MNNTGPTDAENGITNCPSCKSDNWKSAKMIVMEASSNIRDLTQDSSPDHEPIPGGSFRAFLLSDRWLSLDEQIDFGGGLVEEVKRMMVSEFSKKPMPSKPSYPDKPMPPQKIKIEKIAFPTKDRVVKQEVPQKTVPEKIKPVEPKMPKKPKMPTSVKKDLLNKEKSLDRPEIKKWYRHFLQSILRMTFWVIFIAFIVGYIDIPVIKQFALEGIIFAEYLFKDQNNIISNYISDPAVRPFMATLLPILLFGLIMTCLAAPFFLIRSFGVNKRIIAKHKEITEDIGRDYYIEKKEYERAISLHEEECVALQTKYKEECEKAEDKYERDVVKADYDYKKDCERADAQYKKECERADARYKEECAKVESQYEKDNKIASSQYEKEYSIYKKKLAHYEAEKDKALAKYEIDRNSVLLFRELLWERARVCMRCGTAYLADVH